MNESIESYLPAPVSQTGFRSRDERIAIGKSLRDKLPRADHAIWQPPANRRDPIEILEESNQDRIPELIPIRYGRMLSSPFTFLRGSAALMAYDLSLMPNLGIDVQACGDCHLLNFGLFATPERNLVFDINDFDETHPAPWEWDLKRLAVSFVIAGRDNNFDDKDSEEAVEQCVRSYREHLRAYSQMSPLEIWYDRLDMDTIIDMAPNAKSKKLREEIAEKARKRVSDNLFPKITAPVGGRHRFVEQPPLIFRPQLEDFEGRVEEALEDYRESLSLERRVLLDRYRLEDMALKVVGIGSVGTRCYIALFFSEDNHPLILQFKEARRSILEPYTRKSQFDNQGERIVMGQRLMQSSSDIFLGWVRARNNYEFYGRQLRDMKISFPVEGYSALQMKSYAEYCGWTLARTQAKSGDSTTISGYLGKNDQFDKAISKFALAYADQIEKDYHSLVEAVRSGRVEAIEEDF
ncbi:conserved hypothetical protein [Rippkaea orientalis PCC 8801]|uniref:DUF2252 domain-containing protein n=1 Tax=Rippkaea orientalis (strain PCC 8801 / RF-1) TaxID=41431 RepID=B7K4K1_RIPO1|nr:DUF2252 domain-containing protein [Rippkaea orientalis]ACK65466.1 conserved hypothetical protein [Rippkaea orientalis PCC 8801]